MVMTQGKSAGHVIGTARSSCAGVALAHALTQVHPPTQACDALACFASADYMRLGLCLPTSAHACLVWTSADAHGTHVDRCTDAFSGTGHA